MDIARLVYRSHATAPLTEAALQRLLSAARQRNAAEGLTGVLLVDKGRFVQWLEGPAASLERVWQSIRRDGRHGRIELLPASWSGGRLFPDWHLQLGVPEARPDDVASRDAPDALILGRALSQEAQAGAEGADDLMQALSLRQQLPDLPWLVAQSIADDDEPWCALAERLALVQPSLRAMNLVLFRPLARALGDGWMSDQLQTSDVLIALARMQRLLRRVAGSEAAHRPVDRSVLVATLPGEQHLFGVSFAAMALDHQGWHVQCLFPRQTEELLRALQASHVDVLHLALSDSFRREERMPELAATVRAARRVSRNPKLHVLLGGRAFAEQPGLAVFLGADGDGLGQGTGPAELQAMLEHAQWRRDSPAAMVAQATLNELVLHLQARQYGVAAEMPGHANRS
jgi:hypothetical protein